MYTINATTGALTSTGTISGNCPGLCFPSSVVVDPSGKFAYVANGGRLVVPYSVAMYTINATTGALTSIGTIAAGGDPVSVAVDPAGKFVYVATANATPGSAGSVSMYAINATTGALTSIGTIAAGTDPGLRSRGSFWQVRLRDEFRLERCLDVHHQRHDRGLNVYRDDRRGNRSCLRSRGSIWQVRLRDEFRLERCLDVHHQQPLPGP